jgi:hypothetical protein
MPHKYNPTFAAARRRQNAKNLDIRVPRWWSKEVKAGTAIASCPNCHALYFDKHWHTWSNASTVLPKGHKVREEICAACRMLVPSKKGDRSEFGYEGEVVLSGLNDTALKLEIVRLIKNVSARAVLRDPEAQVIKIEDKGRSVRVTTTVNQLAEAIGKEVASAHKGGELNIRFSNDNLPVRVYWTAKE